ncbi:MAG: LCP family protein [Anaerovoracaceae bacterium]|jgi:LCP family protein required for cell wall assembly
MDARRIKTRKKKRLRVIVIIIAIIVAAAAIASAYTYNRVISELDKLDTVKLTGKLDIDPKVGNELKNYRNILLLGIDTRAGESDDYCRSDACIVISINKKTEKVRMISVVRDSYLDIEENGEHVLDKLTHAHAYAGPRNTIRALNRNLDLNIREYMRVNWRTVADLVDELGGVTVNIKDYEVAEMNKYIRDTNQSLKGSTAKIEKPGRQKLNGVQAVTYCRIRKVGNGDVERAQRMRRVLTCCYDKIKEKRLSELTALADKVLPEINTNLDGREAASLLYGFTKYKIVESEGWPYEWDGATINGVSYDVPITLEYNVEKLHEDAFGQKNYKPTKRVREISERVAQSSGYYSLEL